MTNDSLNDRPQPTTQAIREDFEAWYPTTLADTDDSYDSAWHGYKQAHAKYAVDAWQDIATAPKEPLHRFSDTHFSGPDILCCNAENVRQGAAMTINHLSTMNGGKTWDWAFWQARNPTHWMPLPIPPTREHFNGGGE